MRRRVAVLLVASLLAACSSSATRGSSGSDAGTGETTTSLTGSPTTPPGSDASTTTTPTTAPTEAPGDTVVALPGDAPCAMHPPTPAGEATFVKAGKLWAMAGDRSITCLADLGGRDPSWIAWSPDGDEVLIGPDTVLRANGKFGASGYFADNTSVRWSAPTGKALIAPKQSTGELIWRHAHDSGDRIDITFTDATTSAAYHPAGKHIAAAGVGRDGNGPGVFLASNRGANAQRLGALEPGTIATQVAFEMNGDSLVFIHQHPDGGAHVHRYSVTLGGLETVAELDITPTDLTTSPVDQGDLAWTEPRSTVNSFARVLVAGSGEPVVARDPVGDRLSRPLGWLPGHQLLFASMAQGTDVTTFDLWQWTPAGQTEMVTQVRAAAGRTIHGAYNELPLQLGSGFG